MNQGRLAGRVAWISGATSGIGEATARLFAEKEPGVALVGRRGELGQKIADQITAAGGEALAIACDVTSEADVRSSLDTTATTFGGLHIVVNNAGMVAVKLLDESSEEEWDQVMAVNVKSIFFSTKHAFPYFRRQKGGYIVNVGSVSSFVGQASTPAYTTSKHAVLGLTRSIALDYAAEGIRCNCVCPGITDTPMLRQHLDATADPEGTLAGRLRRVAMGVALTPADVARSILFFSCEDSSGVTGTSLTIDCGYLAAAEWDTTGKTAFMEPTCNSSSPVPTSPSRSSRMTTPST